ncbi:Choline transporter-like protein ctl1 [Teratosphaeria destructans]|uniref:Protein PNS1 n=1 Tax=Teratosphaeria destructans TaxID=418781 RepID=A0A9W7W4D7_9PEZI|nr:Choline transporter-like protein ctl1 [Teratosphaeria destructans]
MFSEYASRFLQQSEAHLSHSPSHSRSPLDRRRYQHPATANPAASHSRFPFASRLARQPQPEAPLFFSTAEDFPDDDDEQKQHDREVEDAFALQKSRIGGHFARSHLTESSELEDDGVEPVDAGQNHDRHEGAHARGRADTARVPGYRDRSLPDSEASSAPTSNAKARLVDVNLASTIHEEPPESLTNFSAPPSPEEERPPPFQTFKTRDKDPRQSSFMPMSMTDEEAHIGLDPHPSSPGVESVPAPTVILPAQEPPKHDAFWANIFQICLFAMFAAFVLIWFHTSTPSSSKPIGDTIYSALRGSTYMLLWDTFISIIVALVWLALLRNYVRPLVFIMLAAAPIILFVFSLYPFVTSFKGRLNGSSYQDRALRWASLVPAIIAIVWAYNVIRSRHSLDRAIKILEFSTKILVASPHLVTLGFVTLGVVVGWTWLWMLMFERVFLSGHLAPGTGAKFILDANSWWLGAFFVLQYLWTLGVIAGVQRATSAAVVSQWYFHRLAVPQPTSEQVVRASFSHATGAAFGTVCLSTFLSLLVRLPLIILPGRLSSLVNMAAYWIIPSSLATLTNPLTLTYAAIFSQPLGIATRGLGSMSFVSPTNPSNTLSTRPFQRRQTSSPSALIPWRLSKLLLQATRYVMSFALGFSGWIRTARTLPIDGGLKGSLYAYVVGFVAASIGFAVLGAIENVVGAVLDAAVICWASETGGVGRGEARFCREAGELFGEEERF